MRLHDAAFGAGQRVVDDECAFIDPHRRGQNPGDVEERVERDSRRSLCLNVGNAGVP